MASIIRRAGAHILKMLESAADPAAVANQVQVYSKDDAGVSQLFARASDGTIYQLTPTAIASPSLAVGAVASTNVHAVNLTTLGDIDWMWIGNIATACNPPRTQALANGQHQKKGGPAWLWQGLDYVWAGAGLAGFGQNSNFRTMQSTASDSCALAAVNSLSAIGLNTPGGVTGWGFRLAIPAPGDGISRTLRFYGCQFSNIMTHTAILTDGSATAAAVTTDSGGGAQADFLTTITYKSRYGGHLIYTGFVTTNHSVGSNMRLQGASIGTA